MYISGDDQYARPLTQHPPVQVHSVLFSEGTNQVERCQKHLIKYYTRVGLKMHTLPWDESTQHVSKIYTKLDLKIEDLPKEKESDSLETLLKATTEHIDVERVLIAGKSGCGKSTLCRKLVHDWILNVSKSKLDLVFLVEVARLEACFSFKENVYKQLIPSDADINWPRIWKYIADNPDKCLFVIDGLDELGQKEISDMHEFLTRKRLFACRSIMTTRPEITKYDRFVDRRCKLKGFSQESMIDYVMAMPEICDNVDALLDFTSEFTTNQSFHEFCTCPLLLAAHCIMYAENGKKLFDVGNKYFFLGKLTEFLIRRAIKRKSTLSALCTFREGEALHQLSRLAFTAYMNGTYLFTEDDLNKYSCADLVNFGLLDKTKAVSRLNDQKTFCFPHVAIQEYCTTQYVCEAGDETAIRNIVKVEVKILFEKATNTIPKYLIISILRLKEKELCALDKLVTLRAMDERQSLNRYPEHIFIHVTDNVIEGWELDEIFSHPRPHIQLPTLLNLWQRLISLFTSMADWSFLKGANINIPLTVLNELDVGSSCDLCKAMSNFLEKSKAQFEEITFNFTIVQPYKLKSDKRYLIGPRGFASVIAALTERVHVNILSIYGRFFPRMEEMDIAKEFGRLIEENRHIKRMRLYVYFTDEKYVDIICRSLQRRGVLEKEIFRTYHESKNKLHEHTCRLFVDVRFERGT